MQGTEVSKGRLQSGLKPISWSIVRGNLTSYYSEVFLPWKQALYLSQICIPLRLYIFKHWVDLNMRARLPGSQGRRQSSLVTFVSENGIVNSHPRLTCDK